jgi:hypothetical protein
MANTAAPKSVVDALVRLMEAVPEIYEFLKCLVETLREEYPDATEDEFGKLFYREIKNCGVPLLEIGKLAVMDKDFVEEIKVKESGMLN